MSGHSGYQTPVAEPEDVVDVEREIAERYTAHYFVAAISRNTISFSNAVVHCPATRRKYLNWVLFVPVRLWDMAHSIVPIEQSPQKNDK